MPSEPIEEPIQVPVPVPTLQQLFPRVLPLDPGPLPSGIANTSAQACASCHYATHDAWSAGAHSGGHGEFFALVDALGMPACGSCHRPLARQHTSTVQYDQDDATRPVQRDNHGTDLTLQSEGVSCAACHVRDGAIVASRPVADAPHDIVVSAALGRSEGCAACHQLSFPGAPVPLYDTFGEWSRSPWAEAGVQCQDCHMASAADGGSDHTMLARTGKGLSVVVQTDARHLVRGGEAIEVQLVLQNVGAGHSLPTGSPFLSWRLDAWLEGPVDRDGQPITAAAFTEMIGATVGSEPPFLVQQDTRLAPFEQRELLWSPQLDVDAPQGTWNAVVTVSEQITGRDPKPPIRSWRFPFVVR